MWRRSRQLNKLPSALELQQALQASNYHNLLLSPLAGAQLKNGAKLDLGGIGKGYAAELTSALFKKQHCSCLLSFGTSSVAVLGRKADGQKWRIGLKIPLANEEEYYGILEPEDCFISTSGAYEQTFTLAGKTYHHLLNPQTGYPAANSLQAVTVICDRGSKSEAFSTALFVMGLKKALAFYAARKDFEAIFVLKDGQILITPGAGRSFSFTGEKQGLRLSAL